MVTLDDRRDNAERRVMTLLERRDKKTDVSLACHFRNNLKEGMDITCFRSLNQFVAHYAGSANSVESLQSDSRE